MKPKTRFYKFTAWLLTVAMLMTFMPTALIVAASDSVPVVTDVSFNSDSSAYDEDTNTFFVSDSNPFVLTVTGENLTKFNEMGGLDALFNGESSNAGWVIIDVSIHSDTEAYCTIDTFAMTYILNNSFGSSKTTAVMLECQNTKYGDTIYVNLTHAPTRELRIGDTEFGTVYHDNLFSNYIAVGATVTLTITPDDGYELESLIVGGTDVTEQVSGDTYTFTMPDNPVAVEATFRAAPNDYAVASVTTEYGTTEYSDITSAIAAAEASSGSTLTLLDNILYDGTVYIESGMFTMDLNGKTWEFSNGYLCIRNDADIKIDDSIGGGLLTATGVILLRGSAKLEIAGGTIDGIYSPAVDMSFSGIETSAELIVSGGKLTSDYVVLIEGIGNKITISDGEFVTDNYTISWKKGIIDLSQHLNPAGISFIVGCEYTDISIDKISLPEGYQISEHSTGRMVTDLIPGGLYKIVAEDDGSGDVNEPIAYELWVGGEQFTSEKLTVSDEQGGTATYDPDTNTLTLNNYSYEGISEGVLYQGDGDDVLNLVLNGENSLTIGTEQSVYHVVAVLCLQAELVISGNGSLNAKVNNDHLSSIADGIYVEGDIVIKGGNITATGGEGQVASGLFTNYNIIIKGGEVNATGGKTVNGYGVGILSAAENITIENGTVTATGGNDSSGYGVGIMARSGDITIAGGTVTATGGEDAWLNYGFYSNSLSITGGVVTAEGKIIAIYSYDTSIGDGLGVYGRDGAVIENPDFNTLTYARIDALSKYTLTWSNGDGGSYEQEVVCGSTITVPDNEFFNDTMGKTGYTLNGWVNNDGYIVGDTMPAKDLTFTAQYTANTYTITFNPSGGYVDPASMTTVGGKLGSLPVPTRSGYSFNGWYDAETGGNMITTDTVFDRDTTVYAQWGIKFSGGGGGSTRHTVKFDTNGGNTIASKTVTRNTKVDEPAVPVRDGYTFEGWYTDSELTAAYDFESKVTKSITLYAKWKKSDDKDSEGSGGHDCPSLTFDDLDIAQWYHSHTDYVIANDIFRGTAKSTFTPHGNITRAMMITVLYRAEGEPEVSGEATFEDIDKNAYYANAVVWGQRNGIIKGYSDTKYAPEQDILREQIGAIMHRYAKYKGYDVSVGEDTNILSYEDFDDISEYAIPSMQWAVGSGMIKGRTETTLNPDAFATRVEIAAMLHRFIEANK